MNGPSSIQCPQFAGIAGASAQKPPLGVNSMKFGQAEDKMERSHSRGPKGEGQLAPDEFDLNFRRMITRPLRMAGLRFRGWLEVVSYFLLGPVGWLFPIKHALEGLLGVDSIFRPRTFRVTNISGAVSKVGKGRTLWGVLKAKLGRDKNATAT